MLYLAMTFWLLVIVFTAWGVHALWGGMMRARLLNVVLLPGTLVAQVGHVLGLLITGARVTDTALVGDDTSGAPATTTNPQPRIPLLGPVIIGLLPLAACAGAIYVAAAYVGQPMTARVSGETVGANLPTSLAGGWQLLRDGVSLAESFAVALGSADFYDWRTWVFLYLLICLSIRMAPFPGTVRGSLGAIVVLGLGTALITSLFDVGHPRARSIWGVLSLTVAALLFLMVVSLLVRGAVGLVRLVRSGG